MSGVPFFMDFNIQHKQIEKICKKYWNIVKAERTPRANTTGKAKIHISESTHLEGSYCKECVGSPCSEKVLHF